MENEITYDDAFKFTQEKASQPIEPPRDKKGKPIAPTGGMGSLAEQMKSTYREEDTGLGRSKYDENIAFDADIDAAHIAESLNEFRAQQQSGLTQLGVGILRAGTKAAIEVAKLPGVVGGMLVAPFAKEGEGYDTAFNNSWIKNLDKINETINTEALPVYVKKAVKEGNLWDNITSTGFWATEGADGLGFMIGMMAPGAILNKLSLGSKLIGGTAKAAEYAGMANKTENAVNVMKGLGLTANKIDVGLNAVVNTLTESGAEAAGVGNDLDAKKQDIINGYTLPRFTELDVMRRTGQINNDQYNQMSQQIADEAEAKFTEQRALAMRDTFKANLGILIIPNLLMSKALFGTAGNKLAKEVEKTGTKGLLQRIGKSATRYGEAFASEGFVEEAGQTTAQNLFTKKAERGELQRGDEGLLGGIKDFTIGEATQAYLDTVSSNEGQKAVFLGGIMGAPMMSYQGRKEDVETYRKTKEYETTKNSILQGLHTNTNNFNTIFENDIYKRNDQGEFEYEKDEEGNPTSKRVVIPSKVIEVANALNLKERESKIFEQAIEEGDEATVNAIKQKAIFDMVEPAIHNGEAGMDALEQKLQEYSQMEEIKAKDADPNNKQKSDKVAKEVLSTAKWLQEQNQKFQDFGPDVIQLNDPKMTPEIKEAFMNNLNRAYLNTKFNQRNAERKLKDLQEQRNNITDDLGIERNLVTEDERLTIAEKNSPVLKRTNDEIRTIESFLEKTKKDISEIWSAGGKEKINKEAKTFTNQKVKEEKQTNPEVIDRTNEIITQIKSNDVTEISHLEDIKRQNEDLFKENPILQQEYDNKIGEINVRKQAEQEVEETRKRQEFQDNKENDPENDGKDDTIVNPQPSPLDPETESILDPEDVEVNVDKHGNPIFNEDPEVSEKDDITVEESQAGAKLISTRRLSTEEREAGDKAHLEGTALFPQLDQFIEYERNPRDKTDDTVQFGIGNIDPRNTSAILDKLRSNEVLTREEVSELENYLPIKTILSNLNNRAYSYLEVKTDKNIKIFKTDVLPLRKNIIKALIANKGNFKNIEGQVKKQLPGTLKVEDREEGTTLVKNSILELNDFKNADNKIEHFQKNTAYVNFAGDLVSTLSDEVLIPGFGTSGEIYLKTNKANGEDFWLKLNVNSISEDQGSDLFELMMLRFQMTKGEIIPLSRLKGLIQTPSLQKEIDLMVKKLDLADVNAATVNKLIDLMIFNGNSNYRTRFGLYFQNHTVIGKGEKYKGKTGVHVGTLFDQFLGSETRGKITADQLITNPEMYKDAFVQFFKYKRHNVLVKSKAFNFGQKEYVEYLLDKDNPILTTNAVVNQPTFQGFANIYLDHNVTVNGKSTSEVKEVFGEHKGIKPIVVKPTHVIKKEEVKETIPEGELSLEGLKQELTSTERLHSMGINKSARIAELKSQIEELEKIQEPSKKEEIKPTESKPIVTEKVYSGKVTEEYLDNLEKNTVKYDKAIDFLLDEGLVTAEDLMEENPHQAIANQLKDLSNGIEEIEKNCK